MIGDVGVASKRPLYREGAAMRLSKTLQPMEPLKHKMNVIEGLYVKALTGQGIHPGQTGSLLSGAKIARSSSSPSRKLAPRDMPPSLWRSFSMNC